MSYALQPSSSISNRHFFRGRFLWIVAIALLLSVGLYSAIRFTDRTDASQIADGSQTGSGEVTMIGIQPPNIQQINEFTDGAVQKLRLAGDGEAGAVVVITNLGERLRQIRVNELGQWGLTLNVDDKAMALEALLYTEDEAASIRSEETIFRIPAPVVENADPEASSAEALIMVTAPGVSSRIIQSPFGDFPTSGPLSLSVIDYDYAGGVSVTGTSAVPGRIRIYAQDAVIGDVGIGVSGRWSYIAGRMLPRGDVMLRFELIPAQGAPNAPEQPASLSVPYNFLPPLREEQTDGSGALFVNFEPLQWQVRRTLIGGGGQSTVIFSPEIVTPAPEALEPVDSEN
jgi:hypothetical protein